MHAETGLPVPGRVAHGIGLRRQRAPRRTSRAASPPRGAANSRRRSAAASITPASNSHLTGARGSRSAPRHCGNSHSPDLPLEVQCLRQRIDRHRPAGGQRIRHHRDGIARHHDLGGFREQRRVAVLALRRRRASRCGGVMARASAATASGGVRGLVCTAEHACSGARHGPWHRPQAASAAAPSRRSGKAGPPTSSAIGPSGCLGGQRLRARRRAAWRVRPRCGAGGMRYCAVVMTRSKSRMAPAGRAEADGARAALRLALDVEGDHAGGGLRTEHEVRPWRRTRSRRSEQQRREHGNLGPRELKPLHLEGPARGLGKGQSSGRGRPCGRATGSRSGAQRPCCSARASRSTSSSCREGRRGCGPSCSCSARARAASPMRWRSAGSSRKCASRAARASSSRALTRWPVTPSIDEGVAAAGDGIHGRKAARHGFERHVAEGLALAREEEDVGGGIGARQFLAMEKARENAVLQAGLHAAISGPSPMTSGFTFRSLRGQRIRARACRSPVFFSFTRRPAKLIATSSSAMPSERRHAMSRFAGEKRSLSTPRAQISTCCDWPSRADDLRHRLRRRIDAAHAVVEMAHVALAELLEAGRAHRSADRCHSACGTKRRPARSSARRASCAL